MSKPKGYYQVWKAFVVPAENRTRRQIVERSSRTNETLAELSGESRKPAPINTPSKETGR